ncbi:MAG: hypothetical protein QOH95_2383 [Gaiellaceae bacterium]|nr:hypothetical protein [Gaiellaceae bacterium]
MSEQTQGPQDRRAGWSYCGEAWTDADGHARIALPPAADVSHSGFVYELAAAGQDVTAELVEELRNGFFVLATNRPHAKVAWRLTELAHPNTLTPPGGTP